MISATNSVTNPTRLNISTCVFRSDHRIFAKIKTQHRYAHTHLLSLLLPKRFTYFLGDVCDVCACLFACFCVRSCALKCAAHLVAPVHTSARELHKGPTCTSVVTAVHRLCDRRLGGSNHYDGANGMLFVCVCGYTNTNTRRSARHGHAHPRVFEGCCARSFARSKVTGYRVLQAHRAM